LKLKAPSTNINNQPKETRVAMEVIDNAFSNKSGKANFGILKKLGVLEERPTTTHFDILVGLILDCAINMMLKV